MRLERARCRTRGKTFKVGMFGWWRRGFEGEAAQGEVVNQQRNHRADMEGRGRTAWLESSLKRSDAVQKKRKKTSGNLFVQSRGRLTHTASICSAGDENTGEILRKEWRFEVEINMWVGVFVYLCMCVRESGGGRQRGRGWRWVT